MEKRATRWKYGLQKASTACTNQNVMICSHPKKKIQRGDKGSSYKVKMMKKLVLKRECCGKVKQPEEEGQVIENKGEQEAWERYAELTWNQNIKNVEQGVRHNFRRTLKIMRRNGSR